MELGQRKVLHFFIIFGAICPIIMITAFYPIYSLLFYSTIFLLLFSFKIIAKSDSTSIYFLFIVSVLQNVVVICLMGIGNIPSAYYLQYYKEILLLLMLSFTIMFKNRILKNFNFIDTLTFLFLIYIMLIAAWIGNADMTAKIASIRQLIIPFLFYLLGKQIIIQKLDLIKLLKKIVNFSIIMVLFGIFESYIHPNFWEDVNITNFFLARRGTGHLAFTLGLPLSFYTFDFSSLVGPLRRMASFVANPPVLGHLLACSTILLLFNRNLLKKKRITVMLLMLGVFLTIGKGGIITLFIGSLFYIFFILRKKFLAYLLSCCGIFGAFFYLRIAMNDSLSGSKHVFGLVDNIRLAFNNFWGSGVGSSGNLASLYNQNSEMGGGGESFSGLVLGQVGIPGFIIYSLFFAAILFKLYRKMEIHHDDKMYYSMSVAILSIIFSMYLTGFVTESAISFTSAGVPLLLAGVMINNSNAITTNESAKEKKA